MSVADRTWAEPVMGPGGDPQLGCDLPLDLGPVHCHNELLVGGWAVAGAGSIAAVEVDVDDWRLTAGFGLPSPFLEPAFPGATHNRFELRLDTRTLARGEHELRVRARTTEGAVAEMAGTVSVEPFAPVPWRLRDQRAAVAADEPAMWCESPNIFGAERVRLPVTLRGWAHHPSGIAAVAAFVGGARVDGLAGLPRADLREALGPAVVAASGFRVRVTAQDVAPGPHDVTIVAYPVEGEPIGVRGSLELLAPGAAWSPSAAADEDDEVTAERYVPDRHVGTSIEIEHQARYRWAATLVDCKEVLDAGCGTGWGSALLARGGATRVVGVDVNPLAVKHGQAEHGELVDLRVGDLCRLDLPDASFDLAVCFEAIEHLDDPFSALDHLRRVLRPDGVLIVSTPVKGVYIEGNPFHVHEFEAGELEAALRRRFEHVRADRQRTHAATLLADDRTMSVANVERALELEVRKTSGFPPGQELYTVVSASDGILPPSPRLAILGEALDFTALGQHLRETVSQLDEAEARAAFADMHLRLETESRQWQAERLAELERELEAARAAREVAERRLRAVVDSKSWRGTAPLRAAARRARERADQRKKP